MSMALHVRRLISLVLLGSLISSGLQHRSFAQDTTSPDVSGADAAVEELRLLATQCLLLRQERDYAKTLAACEEAIAAMPESAELQEEMGSDLNNESSAENSTNEEEFDGLTNEEEAASTAATVDPLNLWEARSYALFMLGRYAEAIASYEYILGETSQNSVALTYQCAALFHLDHNEAAIRKCEQALRVDGNWGTASPALAWYYRGQTFLKVGRLESSLDSFNRAVSGDINFLPAKAARCMAEIELSQFEYCRLEEVPEVYAQALAKQRDDYYLWYQQGLALEQLGEYESALISYQNATNLNPAHSLSLAHKCAVLNQLGNFEAALEACEAALAGDQNWGRTTVGYGWSQHSAALIGLEDYEAAIASTERALALNSDYPSAWNFQAVAFWNLGQYDQAETTVNQALTSYLKLEPIFEESFERQLAVYPIIFYRELALTSFNRGRINASQSNFRTAVEAYQTAININDRESDNYNLSSLVQSDLLSQIYGNFAVAQFQLGSFGIAVNSAVQAARLDTTAFTNWYNLGRISLAANQNIRSWCSYQQANALFPDQQDVLIGQGMALSKLGYTQLALEVFENILNLYPENALAQREYSKLMGANAPIASEQGTLEDGENIFLNCNNVLQPE
jgi:tetratricopeptide (TPR) repeat protein